MIRGGEAPAQFKIQARGNVHPLSIGGELLQAGRDAVVPQVSLIPGGHPGAIKAENEQPARVAVAVVVGADVLEVHGEAAGEAPRLIDKSIMTTNLGSCQQIRFVSPLYIDAPCFVTECKALHEAVVTILQTRYTGSFFSYNVKFCDEAARCLSNLFPLFDLNIGHLGGSRNKELSQFKLKNIVVNRDSYARISGRL